MTFKTLNVKKYCIDNKKQERERSRIKQLISTNPEKTMWYFYCIYSTISKTLLRALLLSGTATFYLNPFIFPLFLFSPVLTVTLAVVELRILCFFL